MSHTANASEFNRTSQETIPTREDYKKGSNVKAEEIWYTNGSKLQKEVGANIYGVKTRVRIPLNLAKNGAMFQAEIAAIKHCVEELLRQKL